MPSTPDTTQTPAMQEAPGEPDPRQNAVGDLTPERDVAQAAGVPTAGPAPRSPWPQSFDGFELLRPLGAGGMATVFLARETALDRLVAVKFIAADFTDPMARQRLQGEAKAIARLQHPNIVAIYRIGEVQGHPYIAYEFVEGRTLDDLARPVDWMRVLRIGVGLSRGLAVAHHRGIIHRDLKPANVMLTAAGEVKLLDFGLARMSEQGGDLSSAHEPTVTMSFAPGQIPSPDGGATVGQPSATDGAAPDGITRPPIPTHLRRSMSIQATSPIQIATAPAAQHHITRAGTLLGTPLYMAPELWRGQVATAKVDVYALGLVLYELLAGRLPHAQLELAELALFICNYDLPNLAEDMPTLPRQLTSLIERCVKRDPAERVSIDVVRSELEALTATYLPFFGQGVDGAQPNADLGRVTASFLRISRLGEQLALRFYERMFELEPELRSLFPTDLAPQARMLMTALKLTVESLQHPDRLLSYLDELGRRHAHYGVKPRYLGLMGKALLEVLPSVDPEWTDSTGYAWSKAYGHIAQLMQRGIESVRASQQLPLGAVGRAYWEVPLFAPQTTWIQRRDGDLAYQRFGHGALEVVVVWDWISNLEQLWQSPRVATFFRHLASVARVTLFDRRGCGLSAGAVGPPSLDQQVTDILAIQDHAGIDRSVLFAMGDGCVPALLLSATHSERVRGLCLFGPGRCIARAMADATPAAEHETTLPGAHTHDALLSHQLATIRSDWGGPLFIDTLAPSLAREAGYRRFWAAFLRLSASPSEAAALFQHGAAQRIQPILSGVRVPTLILHRSDDRHRPAEESQQLVAHIRGAHLQLLPGADHQPWAGDIDSVLSALHTFLISLPSSPVSGTMAGCVLAVSAGGGQLPAPLLHVVRNQLAMHRAVTVDAPVGPTLVAYFDGPMRAVQCALSIQTAALGHGLTATVGLDLGQLTQAPTLRGDAVDRAVALAMVAAPGQVLLSDAMRTLTGSPDLEFTEQLITMAGEAAHIVYTVRTRPASPQPGGRPV